VRKRRLKKVRQNVASLQMFESLSMEQFLDQLIPKRVETKLANADVFEG